MREAYDLAYATAFLFTKAKPIFISQVQILSKIKWKKKMIIINY